MRESPGGLLGRGSWSCNWCCCVVGIETWVSVSARRGHANDKTSLRATRLGAGHPARRGVYFQWLTTCGSLLGNTPKGGGFTVAQPTGSPTQIGRARGARGRARPSRNHRFGRSPQWPKPAELAHPPHKACPKKQPTVEHHRRKPPNTPTAITPKQPHRRRENQAQHQPRFGLFPKALRRRRTANTNHQKHRDSRNHNTTRLHAVQALTLACAAAHEHPTRGVSPDTTVHDGA